MKKALLLVSLQVIVIFATAQLSNYVDLTIGPISEEKQTTDVNRIVGADASGVYVYGISSSTFSAVSPYMLTKYNSQLAFDKREKIEYKLGPKGSDIMQAPAPFYFGSHLLVCGLTMPNFKETILKAYEVDKNTLLRSGEPMDLVHGHRKLLSSFTAGYFTARDELGSSSGFHSHPSREKKKMVVYGIPGQDKDENQEISIVVYNSDMTKDWERNFTLPYLNELISIEGVLVDEFGKVYVIAIVFHDKVKFKVKGKPNYEYVVLQLRKESDKPVEFKVYSKEHFLVSMGIGIFPDGHVVGVGFYSDQLKETVQSIMTINSEDYIVSVKGTITYAFDLTAHSAKEVNYKPFSQDELAYLSDKKKSNGGEVKDFMYRDFYVNDDGSAFVLAEKEYVTGDASIQVGNGKTKLHEDEIIAIHLTPDLNIQWMKVIPKKQRSVIEDEHTKSLLDFLSFTSCSNENRILIFYNDNPKNSGSTNGNEDAEDFKKSSAVPFVAVIEASGEWKKFRLSENPDVNQLIIPGLAYQPADDVLYLYLEEAKGKWETGKKESRLVKVKMKS